MKHHDYLKPVFIVSLTVLLGFGFIQLGIQSITPIWNSGITNQITIVIMLALIAVWLIGWVGWDAYESEEVDKQLSKYITAAHRVGAYLIGILIAISFAAMASNIGNIAIFIPLMSTVVLATSIGDHIVIRNLVRKVRGLTSGAESELINYYTNRPHMLLHCLQLFFLAVAAAAYLFMIRNRELGNEWIVYLILSISIITNEIVLWRWRWPRIQEKRASI
jgi:hypothetical protein